MSDIDALIRWFETLERTSVERIGDFYAPDAFFKDPFNEVRGLDDIGRIFAHMFDQVADPRFRITERIAAANGAMLAWDFTFRFKPGSETITVRGVSHLRFDADGRVAYHRDYWDAAEELYAKLPLIGALMRLLRRRLSAEAR